MSYIPQNLTDGTVLTAAHLNHVDAGIVANETAAMTLSALLDAIDIMLYPADYHSITINAANCSLSNPALRVEDGASYTTNLAADAHYTLDSVIVTMGGTDITSTAYSNGTISIQSVTGDVTITVSTSAIVNTYQITSAFTNVTGSNQAAAATEGSAYQMTLTPDTGYEITTVSVTMGGTDITSTAYSNGTISIQSVTGDIVITCAAEAINDALGGGKLGRMRLGTRNA